MYQPPAFRETDIATQQAFIASHPLGLLISGGVAGLLANPIPFVIYPGDGPLGTLRAHLSRGNPQWRSFADAADVLIVFQGAEHYVTPSWYAQKAIDGGAKYSRAVPSGGVIYMLNEQKPPFSNLAARQAFAHAINYDLLNDTVFGGANAVPTSYFADESPYFRADLSMRGYDQAKAKDLFAQAVRELGGPIKFTLYATPANTANAEFVQSLVNQYDDVEMSLQTLTGAQVVPLVSTGGTLLDAASELKRRGARRVIACAVHAILSGDAVSRILDSDLEQLIVTDTIPNPPAKLNHKIKPLTVAPMLAEAIMRIHKDLSISAMFV